MGTAHAWKVEVFYDGDCPLCLREIRMLQGRDHDHNILFTNIAEPSFDPATLGLDHTTMMKRIHARLSNGELVEGVEVFRRLYDAVGFRRLVKLSRAPVITQLLDAIYTLFAKNRLRLTGRCEAEACDVPKPT